MAHLPGLGFELGETIDMLRDRVRSFAADEIAPRGAAIDHDNLFPADLWKKLGDLGLHGMTADRPTQGDRRYIGVAASSASPHDGQASAAPSSPTRRDERCCAPAP